MPALVNLPQNRISNLKSWLLVSMAVGLMAVNEPKEDIGNAEGAITKGVLNPTPKKPSALKCEYLFQIQRILFEQHIKMSIAEGELEKRTVEQFIKRLDPTKVYLTMADANKIQGNLTGIFDKLKKRDCSGLLASQKVLIEKVAIRSAFAKKFLGPEYKFDSTTEFLFDPDKKAFAATDEEAEEFLKKYIHFQVSNYLESDMKTEEARTNVVKSWDRAQKRTAEMNEDDVFGAYLDSFARAMDPHSAYMLPENNEDFKIQMSLKLQGIGATLRNEDGFTLIEALVPGGPAAKSGLLMNQDKIIAVAQGDKGAMEDVIEMELRDVVKRIRGAKGTVVRLMIMRKDTDGTTRKEVRIVRDEINLEDDAASINYIERIVGGKKLKIGIINFPGFYSDSRRGGRSSAADVKKLILEARKSKVDGLVLDLSMNGGGSLEDAVKVAGLFFGSGAVVKQSMRDGTNRPELTLKDNDSGVDWPGPLVVLTSRISASASEIVAGTLKDYGRAIVVGSDHTFGKGTIQSVVDIPPDTGDLGAVKVTVGMFYTAGGASTQHQGVEADVVIPGQFDLDETGEKSLDHSLPPAKLPAFLSPEAYVKDGPNAWLSVDPELVKELSSRSKLRVDKSTDFKKVLEDLEKSKKNGKMIKLAEVLKTKKEKDKDKKDKAKSKTPLTKKEKEKEYLKRADINEAASVLADLIELQTQKVGMKSSKP